MSRGNLGRIYIDFDHTRADNRDMKAEDIVELTKNAITLIEHNTIITTFENTGAIDRDEALAKYGKFNNEHPDFYGPTKIYMKDREG